MTIKDFLLPTDANDHTPHVLQRVAMGLMMVLVLLSFAAVNVQALLWQTSDWLVSTILPAVVIDLTNEEREEAAAPPLRRSSLLDAAATLKAEHMAEYQYFAHYSPGGVSPWFWFDEVGYLYAHAGENLAIHFSDSGAVVEGWMNSPAHRANIVSGKYTEIGVGTARGVYEGFETIYVVQLFGTPAVPPPPPPPPPLALAVAAVPEVIPVATTSNEAIFEATTTPATPAAATTTPDSATTSVVAAASASAPELPSPEMPLAAAPEDPVVVADVTANEAVISVYSTLVATSSGLAPQTALDTFALAVESEAYASPVGAFATRPSLLLQTIYLLLGLCITVLLLSSVIISARGDRPWQVAYGVLLLLVMSGLFYLHVTLMSSVVIAAAP